MKKMLFFEVNRLKETRTDAVAEEIERIYKNDLQPFREKKPFRLHGLSK